MLRVCRSKHKELVTLQVILGISNFAHRNSFWISFSRGNVKIEMPANSSMEYTQFRLSGLSLLLLFSCYGQTHFQT